MSKKVTLMSVICVLVCVLLFCEKFTGEALHSILGLIFGIGLFVHILSKKDRIMKLPMKMRTADIVAAISLIVILVSGILMHPMGKPVYLLLLHSIFSIVLVISCVIHVKQHCKSTGK